MSFLGKKCPRCGALVVGGMRFCGRCGLDLETQKTEEPAGIESIRPVRPDSAPGYGERPRPTETARYVAPEKLRGMRRGDIVKLAAAVAAALVIIVIAIVLIVRMNRTAPAPEVSEPVEEIHVIAAEESVAATPEPTPTASPTPTPTPPPATAAPTATPGLSISEVSGSVYALPAALEIRSGPGIEYDAIATVPYGAELTRTGLLDGWTQVDLQGREGYVPNGQISMQKPEPTPTPTPLVIDIEVDLDDIVVVDTGANLRLGPGTEYDVVTTAGAGRELHRTGTIGGWSQVEFDGYKVYVYTELLRSDDEPEVTATPAPEVTAVPEESGAAVSGTVTMRMNANVRTGPGTEYDSLGLAMGGDVLEVTGQENGWYRVIFQGQTGYVLASLAQ